MEGEKQCLTSGCKFAEKRCGCGRKMQALRNDGTERHVLLQCPFANRVCDLVPALHKPDPATITSPESLLQACNRMIKLPPTGLNDTALCPWIFWYLWIGRNKLVFENREGTEHELVSIAVKETRIWQTAQKEKNKGDAE